MNNAKAYILLEALVSLAIFSVGILYLINSLSAISASDKQIRNYNFAALLADNIFSRMNSGEDVPVKSEKELNEKKFTWETDKSFLNDRLNLIKVKISWPEKGKIYSLTLNNIVTKTKNNI